MAAASHGRSHDNAHTRVPSLEARPPNCKACNSKSEAPSPQSNILNPTAYNCGTAGPAASSRSHVSVQSSGVLQGPSQVNWGLGRVAVIAQQPRRQDCGWLSRPTTQGLCMTQLLLKALSKSPQLLSGAAQATECCVRDDLHHCLGSHLTHGRPMDYGPALPGTPLPLETPLKQCLQR